MRRLTRLAAAILTVFTLSAVFSAAPIAAEPVDLLLVFAADVSRSIDEAKFQLQRQGYAAAITDPTVLRTIALGKYGKIAVCFVEWSGSNSQHLLIDWETIGNDTEARAFAQKLRDLPRSFSDRTSISAAIDFAVGQFSRSPFRSERHIIDVSGDGTNNSGRDVNAARDDALENGGITTINGLVILSDKPSSYNPEHTHPPGGLDNYYRQNVVGGDDYFVIVAANFAAFGKAILTKLIREVSQEKRLSKPS